MHEVKTWLGRIALPFLLAVVLCIALFSIYQIFPLSVWNLLSVLICALSFLLCRFTEKHRTPGGLLVIFVVLLMLLSFGYFATRDSYGMAFFRWFFSGAEREPTQTNFLLALLCVFPAFFAMTLYYFTHTLFRPLFLTLIALFPCILSVKVLQDVSVIYAALISILNLAINLQTIRRLREYGDQRSGTGASVLSGGIFILCAALLSAVLPKQTEAPFYDRFEAIFMNADIYSTMLSPEMSMQSEYSGNADFYRSFLRRNMYNITCEEEVPYLKRQNFDYYDYDLDRWYCDPENRRLTMSMAEWKEHAQNMSIAGLQTAIRAAAQIDPAFIEKYHLSDVVSGMTVEDDLEQMTVESTNFSAMFYLSTARMVSVDPPYVMGEFGVTNQGVVESSRFHPEYFDYTISFREEYQTRFDWANLGGCDFDDAESAEMLYALWTLLNEDGQTELARFPLAFLVETAQAQRYQEQCAENTAQVSDRIVELAQEITAGRDSDWLKANALQRYFYEGTYTYDLDYIAPDTSPEYFLFESRRGSCSDYASAFVLMARAIGLTARYTEGFIPQQSLTANRYTVDDAHAHAYPEVFIENMGWIAFEPTAPSYYSAGVVGDNGNFLRDFASNIHFDTRMLVTLAVIAAIVVLIAFFVMLGLPFIQEQFFMVRIHAAQPRRSLSLVYRRIQRHWLHQKKTDALTPNETAAAVSAQIQQKNGIQLSMAPLARQMNDYVFNEKNPDKADKAELLRLYRQMKRAMHKRRRSR